MKTFKTNETLANKDLTLTIQSSSTTSCMVSANNTPSSVTFQKEGFYRDNCFKIKNNNK